MSDIYYGIVWFRDGTKVESGGCSGVGAENSAQRDAQMLFDHYMNSYMNHHIKTREPVRMEVRKK